MGAHLRDRLEPSGRACDGRAVPGGAVVGARDGDARGRDPRADGGDADAVDGPAPSDACAPPWCGPWASAVRCDGTCRAGAGCAMTERILIEGSVDPPLLGQVHALANGIKRVGEESEKLAGAAAQGTRQLGEETAKAAQSTDRLGVSLRGVGEAARHLNEIREAAVAFGEAALGAVRGVAELAGEQQRLNANSARLRLDFAQAARGAGGFATEMQTMQLATNLANRNIRVTQSELDTLARVGMARARDAGQEVDEVFETIADSIIEGGEELGKFGQELLSVADESHNANDRLGALVSRAREVPETMRTASDEVARFESQLRQAGRYVSTGFVEEMARLQTVSSQTRGLRTDAEEARREMEALGRAGAYVLTQVGNVAGILVGAIAMSVRGIAGAFEGSVKRSARGV